MALRSGTASMSNRSSAASALTIGWPTAATQPLIRSPTEIASVSNCVVCRPLIYRGVSCSFASSTTNRTTVSTSGRPHSPSVSAAHAHRPPKPYESAAPSSKARRASSQGSGTHDSVETDFAYGVCDRARIRRDRGVVDHRRGTHLLERIHDGWVVHRATPRIDDLERLASRQRSAVGAVGCERVKALHHCKNSRSDGNVKSIWSQTVVWGSGRLGTADGSGVLGPNTVVWGNTVIWGSSVE
jgi:hypothetical protein